MGRLESFPLELPLPRYEIWDDIEYPRTVKRILTFDVVGTLIDFESGIAEHIGAIVHGAQVEHSTEAILAAFGVAESQLQQSSPDLSFTEMLHPIYLLMSETLGLPPHADDGKGFRDSISD